MLIILTYLSTLKIKYNLSSNFSIRESIVALVNDSYKKSRGWPKSENFNDFFNNLSINLLRCSQITLEACFDLNQIVQLSVVMLAIGSTCN